MSNEPKNFFDDPTDGPVVSIRANGRKRVRTQNNSDSRTDRSDAERADIRRILANFEITGIMDHMRDVDLQFRDVTEFDNLSDALQQAKEAERVFMGLHPKLRLAFDNDVSKWLDAAHDGFTDAQTAALTELGLLEAPNPPATPSQPLEGDTEAPSDG